MYIDYFSFLILAVFNIQEFHRRFDPALTGGLGPEWLRNVYYLYLLELRAIAKAGETLNSQHYGDPETSEQVSQLILAVQEFKSSVKDEQELFDPQDLSKVEILSQVPTWEKYYAVSCCKWDLALRIRQIWEAAFCKIANLGSCPVKKPFGKVPNIFLSIYLSICLEHNDDIMLYPV